MAISRDGFIAEKDGSVGFLDRYMSPELMALEGYKDFIEEHNNFIASVDALVMGRRSYDQTITFGPWAWPDKTSFVFAEQPDTPQVHESIVFTSGSVKEFVARLKQEKKYKHLWLFGGAHLVQAFDAENLIDEALMTEVPDILKEGIALELRPEHLQLVQEIRRPGGILQKVYKRTS